MFEHALSSSHRIKRISSFCRGQCLLALLHDVHCPASNEHSSFSRNQLSLSPTLWRAHPVCLASPPPTPTSFRCPGHCARSMNYDPYIVFEKRGETVSGRQIYIVSVLDPARFLRLNVRCR
jgi:hypothetical protein